MKNFDNPTLRSAMNKILLAFIFYIVAAASFNGFFVKWAFNDAEERYSFEMMFDETAYRPFVHRQFMLDIARGITAIIPEKQKDRLAEHFLRHDEINTHYGLSKVDSRYIVEYNIVYWECFIFLFASMFLWRKICIDLTGNKIAGTLAAIIFAMIFPLLETVGGYFYDFGELLFFSLAIFFACRGHWIALIILSPFAEYNKESFLFFSITLFPILALKLGKKKAALSTISAVIFSGLTYLYVKSLYAGNPGGSTEFHLFEHISYLIHGWTNLEITYGVLCGQGMFLLHIIFVAWIGFNTWKKLSAEWKQHIYIALAINISLYLLFCVPGELRNLSMLYIGFIAMLSIYIKNLITVEGEKFL